MPISLSSDSASWDALYTEIEKRLPPLCDDAVQATRLPEFVNDYEISVLLTSDEHIQQLNSDYRGKDTATNVLSFPSYLCEVADYGILKNEPEPVLLGDIIIAYETVKRESEAQSKPFMDHLLHLVVHGTLHLLGYDHEEEGEATIMEQLEITILDAIGIKNPYDEL